MKEVPGDGGETVEGVRPKTVRGPTSPTAQEIEEHEAIGHAIYRDWCGHCVRARGIMEPHKEVESKDDALPTLALDYFYFHEEEKGLPHLQVKDSKSKMCWASPVPAKGNDTFAVNFVMGILDEVGYNRLIMKSDNEPSVKALKSAIKEVSKAEILLEESKTGDHQSNGLVEPAVRESKR